MRDIHRYTEEYIKQDFEEKQVLFRRRKLLEIVRQYPHQRILEIGCGKEPLFQFVTDFDAYTVVEPSDLFFEHAASLAENDARITCIHDFFGKETVLNEENFDFIICSGLLHELEKPSEILQGCYRLADSGTILHINVPNAKSLHRILALESGILESLYSVSERGRLYQQAGVFDLDSLKALAEENGFDILESGSYFVKPFTHKQMGRLLDEEIIDERVLEGFWGLIKYMPDHGSEIFINARKK